MHPKFRTPSTGTIVTGVTAAVIGGLFPVGVLGHLVSIGTLAAFVTVCIGVLVLRRTRPDLLRPSVPAAVVHLSPALRLRLDDAVARSGDLVAAGDLDGDRHRRLRALRLPQQPGCTGPAPDLRLRAAIQAAPQAHVYELHADGKGHGEVQVALRDLEVQALGHQRKADQDEEGRAPAS